MELDISLLEVGEILMVSLVIRTVVLEESSSVLWLGAADKE